MNIKFSDLTLFGKLLLIPTVAVMAASGYFGAPLIINQAGSGLDNSDKSLVGALGVLSLLPLAAGALGAGALFFALSSGLLRVLGLKIFRPPILPDPRSVRQDVSDSAAQAVRPMETDSSGLFNIKLSDLTPLGRLLLIPTVAVAATAAYLTPLYKLYVGPAVGILFFALSASLLQVLGLRVIQFPSLPEPRTAWKKDEFIAKFDEMEQEADATRGEKPVDDAIQRR